MKVATEIQSAENKILKATQTLDKSGKRNRDEFMQGQGGLVVINPLEDDEDTCHVCCEGLSEEFNKILYCDKCDVAVHQVKGDF